MFKILKIKANGYRLLDDNFEINFLNKTKVSELDLEKSVFEIDKNLYTLKSFAIVGGNSSGKSSILSLIFNTCLFLKTGRWNYVNREYNKDYLNIKVDFYLNGDIYFYDVTFDTKINFNNEISRPLYLNILSEKLIVSKFNKSRGKKNIDDINKGKDISAEYVSRVVNDTSTITKLVSNNLLFDAFNTNNLISFSGGAIRDSFFDVIKHNDFSLVSSVISLLDESIEYIKYIGDNTVLFKRYDEPEIIMKKHELIGILSSGTFRGIELYLRAFEALKKGEIFIVDEIENCFQKKIVFDLLDIFNDPKLNSKGAQIIFSTHYIEVLDVLERQDSIFVVHKKDKKINCKNLKEYNIRTELSKSKQFDSNVFDTSLNYKLLMNVRRAFKNELYSNND